MIPTLLNVLYSPLNTCNAGKSSFENGLIHLFYVYLYLLSKQCFWNDKVVWKLFCDLLDHLLRMHENQNKYHVSRVSLCITIKLYLFPSCYYLRWRKRWWICSMVLFPIKMEESEGRSMWLIHNQQQPPQYTFQFKQARIAEAIFFYYKRC